MSEEGYAASKVLTWVLGIASGLVTIGIVSIVGMLVSMGDRLARMETTMDGNKAERQAKDGNLERRIERLERVLYRQPRGDDD